MSGSGFLPDGACETMLRVVVVSSVVVVVVVVDDGSSGNFQTCQNTSFKSKGSAEIFPGQASAFFLIMHANRLVVYATDILSASCGRRGLRRNDGFSTKMRDKVVC